jgi:hypothetical protein
MKPSNHPTSCPVCHGDGWQPGPPIIDTVNGEPHTWTTVAPCTHIWWDDDHLELDR